ncbi:MAG: hypothetical protein WKI04_05335 [Ferruginibacter sp.]
MIGNRKNISAISLCQVKIAGSHICQEMYHVKGNYNSMKIEKPYRLYTTRRENWFDKNNNNAIAVAEWKSYVKADHQMELINGYKFKIPREIITVNDDGLILWKIHSHNGVPVFDVFFSHENGNIDVASR